MTLQTYREWSPTSYDVKGLSAERIERGDWLVAPVVRTRNSDTLEESNFAAACKLLEPLGAEVHRFGHWGCGWFEILLVPPTARAEVESLAKRLENYPALAEDDWSERQHEAVNELWAGASVKDRVCWCQRYGANPLAARRDYPPGEVESELSAQC